ncbi:MAG: shikimate dehydrogenase [Bacteroidaceae bacterium]|nr:shikimate dehydrogenase [Bacteroidaceae bacterium]
MNRYGLIGKTLGHSFSQRYFTEKFAREGINAHYDNYEMPSADGVVELIASTPDLVGLNVTIPYKKDVIPLLRSLDPDAEAIGAVNVIRIRDMRGFNTDVIGFRESIRPLLQSHHTHALVLGTGGASLAVIHGLLQLGIEPMSVSRHTAPSSSLTANRSPLTVITYDDLDAQVMNEYKVIVNCTPLGTFPNVDECAPIPYHLLTPDHLLFDLVYNPEETLFLRKGREQGAATKNGYEMLLRQAEAAWEIWNE